MWFSECVVYVTPLLKILATGLESATRSAPFCMQTVHLWCGGRWCAHVVWWEMVCTCGVVGDGVHMWCDGRWCAHVVWWEMTSTCGVVGDGVHMWCDGRWCAHVV